MSVFLYNPKEQLDLQTLFYRNKLNPETENVHEVQLVERPTHVLQLDEHSKHVWLDG